MTEQKDIDYFPEETQSLSESTNYTELAHRFGLSSQSSITYCIKSTISGNYWDATSCTGLLLYLSDAK